MAWKKGEGLRDLRTLNAEVLLHVPDHVLSTISLERLFTCDVDKITRAMRPGYVEHRAAF